MAEQLVPSVARTVFGDCYRGRYVLTNDVVQDAQRAIANAIKSTLPKEACRVDVLCYLFKEMKTWVREQHLDL